MPGTEALNAYQVELLARLDVVVAVGCTVGVLVAIVAAAVLVKAVW